MNRSVIGGVRTFGAMVLAISALTSLASLAEAQTKVVLDAPKTEALDTMVRGGSYARTNFDGEDLMTRASDNREFMRRALLKFDTEKYVPKKAVITSATLTLTVKGGNSETRTLSAYRVAQSFDAPAATWNNRNDSSSWKTAGGDFGKKYDDASVTAKVGSKVTFDVTRLVQEAVNGNFGSRWTRIAVIDGGSSSRASYRVYHSSEASDSGVRPALTILYGVAAPPPQPTPPPRPPDDDDPPALPPRDSVSSKTLRLLHWNSYHGGRRTDGDYDPEGFASWLAKFDADVISLNEVDTQSHVNAIVNALEAKTKREWNTSYSGRGNLLITRLSMSSKSLCAYPDGRRYAAHLSTVVNGRPINIWSTHLSVDSARARVAEAISLQRCAQNWSEARILAGDYNMQAGSTEYKAAIIGYTDAWAAAKLLKAAKNYAGNCDGCTRNSRIDYVFSSKGASWLKLKSVEVLDTRNAKGVRASDHKPMLVVYEVQ